MPIYVFRCDTCAAEGEALLALGDTSPRPCPDCAGTMHQKFGRIAVRYSAWGFSATDRLVGSTRGKDFRSLREAAERISDE